MANKKRTQNKRNKRSGKKQRRQTAVKQRGGEDILIPHQFILRLIGISGSNYTEGFDNKEELEDAANKYNITPVITTNKNQTIYTIQLEDKIKLLH